MTLTFEAEKRLGDFVLEARFTSEGGVTALFGPSGSGKTTIVNLVAGLSQPDRGRITLDGEVLVDRAVGVMLPPSRRRIGYVFQDARLFPHLSVQSNLSYGRWFGPRAGRWGDFGAIVELLGIGALLKRRPLDLSGGEKQRVAIGRALLASPRLLLMDEPLAALDRARRAEILPFLERLRDEMKLPILYVSHAVDEVARLADQVVIIEAGRVAAAGPVGTVFADVAADSETGAILTAIVHAEDEIDGVTLLDHPAGVLQIPKLGRRLGTRVRVHIRARDIALAVGEPGRLSIRNRLAARVVAVSEQMSDVAVSLDVGGEPMLARVTRGAQRDLGLAPGLAVTALIKAVALDER
ncbi:molybdate transport system ATP-binding protein [Kaistia soli DSM 19436]|uniref:Molybdate transport system ATP-binding protein n=1 Tax=Kaistia soli DSM 19436 TaxID=1122133 RepID=A0A1M4ZGG5_9HYPH|nr:molybdenum ABC transporter ATP-binding protein [Kaistia soli]SHF16887.1 molybdate transport system ATP-binding protein [Kaistia soli DSM 19436]